MRPDLQRFGRIHWCLVPERSAMKAAARFAPTPAPGFTLMELVVVLVIVSILGAMALPRFVGGSSFDVFGFTEQLAQTLRYAQKAAQSSRRTLCVSVAPAGISLSRAATAGTASCTVALPDPVRGSVQPLPVPSGVSVTSIVIRYNALGQPVSSTNTVITARQDITIVGEHTRQIQIEGETGYVH